MTHTRRFVIATALSAPLVKLLPRGGVAGPAADGDLPERIDPVFTRGGAALSGCDPVAYFAEGRPVSGVAEYRLRWRNAVWKFANDENRRAFEMNPLGYAPVFGGYCAYALAHGEAHEASPDAWTIHEGRLYVKFDISTRVLWRRDISRFIGQAEQHWTRLRHL